MSQLTPLLQKLQESGAERAYFAPNEQGIFFDGDAKRPIPGAPIRGATILEAVSELLSHDDISGLSSRPRIVRHEHDGQDFVLEIVRQANGIALGIRHASKGARGLRDSARKDDPRRDEVRKDEALRDEGRSVARPSKKMRALGREAPVEDRRREPDAPLELDLGPRAAFAPLEERVTKPVQRPAVDSASSAPAREGPSVQEIVRLAVEAARQAAVEAARQAGVEAARQAAVEAARQAAVEAAREIAREVAQSSARESARDAAGQTAREVAAEIGETAARDTVREVLREMLGGAPRSSVEAAPGGERRREVGIARSGPAKIDALLREMLQKKASDMHLTAGTHPVLRVDGQIHFGADRTALSSDDILAMMHEIMTSRARSDFESHSDADFAYEIPGLARFRVNVFQDRQGTGAVLRQIPIEILSAEKLGLPKACLDMCWLTKGLVLVTGPTGSGKSTTLAAMIDFINKNRSDHIITIEDPVEFVHQNHRCLVNQREVGQHTKSFKNALRAALREDPDIVLVGEMRDLETISIAIETAETGHLVFGTLHTTTAISTVDRIIDQFPSDRQDQIRVMLSESLKGVVAQVLLPKIGGGRVAAHEILLGNHAVASMIREGKTFQLSSVMQTSKGQGMVTMNDSLLALVQKKLVDPKQAYLKAVDKSGFAAMLRSAGIAPPV